jgi:hypothetical protein
LDPRQGKSSLCHLLELDVTTGRVNDQSTRAFPLKWRLIGREFVDGLLMPGSLALGEMLDVWMLLLALVLTIVSLVYVRGLEKLP